MANCQLGAEICYTGARERVHSQTAADREAARDRRAEDRGEDSAARRKDCRNGGRQSHQDVRNAHRHRRVQSAPVASNLGAVVQNGEEGGRRHDRGVPAEADRCRPYKENGGRHRVPAGRPIGGQEEGSCGHGGEAHP